MQLINKYMAVTVILTGILAVSGCANMSRQDRTLLGAGTGAAVGVAVGSALGDTTGAIVGGAVGAVGGGAIGHSSGN
jgi:hypothetical protein